MRYLALLILAACTKYEIIRVPVRYKPIEIKMDCTIVEMPLPPNPKCDVPIENCEYRYIDLAARAEYADKLFAWGVVATVTLDTCIKELKKSNETTEGSR